MAVGFPWLYPPFPASAIDALGSSRDDVHDQTALVTLLGRGHTRDELHRLPGVRRNLVRIDAALLIGYGLVVDRELGLRMIPDRMEETVRV